MCMCVFCPCLFRVFAGVGELVPTSCGASFSPFLVELKFTVIKKYIKQIRKLEVCSMLFLPFISDYYLYILE